MSEIVSPPGGLSAKEFKSVANDVSQWLWGTVQGAFNEKQSVSQIITDAVIGMIPLVGDVTAARDLIAVSSGLASDHKKREEKTEWVLLVILVFALVPVTGGVVKGVGRLSLRAVHVSASDSKTLAEIANDIIEFLNRIGHKNAEAWFTSLNVRSHEATLLSKFRHFCDAIIVGICQQLIRFGRWLPQSLVARMEQMQRAFEQLKGLGEKMIPEALQELHDQLAKLQKYVHSGGRPVPGRAEVMYAQTGQKTVTFVAEARYREDLVGKRIRRAGPHQQNMASVANDGAIAKVYKHEPGYPDLLKFRSADGIYYPAIAAASGKINNEMLSGVVAFRSFGPEGVTHGVVVEKTNPAGVYWGLATAPATAEEWRILYAALHEFNRNGMLSIIHIPGHVEVPACVSTVSEQFSKLIPGQYLEGGGRQAVIEHGKDVKELIHRLADSGGGKASLANGVTVEVRPSGWTKANEDVGYEEVVIPNAGFVERLGLTEKQSKMVKQGAQAVAKKERNE